MSARNGERWASSARLLVGWALALICALVLASPAAALGQKLTAADGAASAALGISVAIDGDTLVLGAPGDAGSKGAVYVFQRSGDSWTQSAKLTATDAAAGDLLGASVAIDGDTIVAGAPDSDIAANANEGAVYTFARTGAPARTETAKLTATEAVAGATLGSSVAIDGDTIVAGAPSDDAGTNLDVGAVYEFARTGAARRNETAKLTASDGALGDSLGISVAIDANTIVAGAPDSDIGANTNQGAVYTFARTGAPVRTPTAKLTATDGGDQDQLGFSVAAEGDTIVAGAPDADVGSRIDQGSVYTFATTGGAARTETAELTASDAAGGELLGGSVAIDGDTIVAGAPFASVGGNAHQGSAYAFARAGAAARTETTKLTSADGVGGDLFGAAVAIDGRTIVSGSPADNIGPTADQGSATVFFAAHRVPPPPPPPPPIVKPRLSQLKISPRTFRRGTSLPRITSSRKGTRITFTLSTTAKVALSFARAEPGRAVAKACKRTNRSNLAKRRCTRYVTSGSFTVQGQSGRNTVSFAGTISRNKRLRPGSYRLTATPTVNTSDVGNSRTAKLKIVT
jgi:hypothetical protein